MSEIILSRAKIPKQSGVLEIKSRIIVTAITMQWISVVVFLEEWRKECKLKDKICNTSPFLVYSWKKVKKMDLKRGMLKDEMKEHEQETSLPRLAQCDIFFIIYDPRDLSIYLEVPDTTYPMFRRAKWGGFQFSNKIMHLVVNTFMKVAIYIYID